MENKYEIANSVRGLELRIGERILRHNYLSQVTDILLDVGSTSYLTLSFGSKIEGSDKVVRRWVSTVELNEFSNSELVELIVILIRSSSCENLMIDSHAMGKGVIDGLIPVLERVNKSHLLEITTTEDVQKVELLGIVADIENKMDKLRQLMSN